MRHALSIREILPEPKRADWRIEDLLAYGARLDFDRPFLPEALARTAKIPFLTTHERRILNQVRGHEYLALLGLIEESILPYVLDRLCPKPDGGNPQARKLLALASKEAKRVDLIHQFERLFDDGFGADCPVIGPAETIAAGILRHDALAVALFVLMIEWMSQIHYLDGVRDDAELDPLFKNLLRLHSGEEFRQARLDVLILERLAAGRNEEQIEQAIDAFLDICAFLDTGLKVQAGLNLDAFEAASGRRLSARERAALGGQQHQALRFTYLGSGMAHPKFLASLQSVSRTARERIAEAAPVYS